MNQHDTTDVFSKTTSSSRQTASGLFSDKKRMAIATATVLAGGTALAWGLTAKGEPSPTTQADPSAPLAPGGVISHGQTWPVQGGTITPTGDVQIGLVNDSMSFEEAFQAARTQTGPGGIFIWHGQVYNTYHKEEWSGLALAQRQEFLSDVGFKPVLPTPHDQIPHNSQDAPSSVSYTIMNSFSETPADETSTGPGFRPPSETQPEPIEGFVNGQRAIGYDFDGDGMVDLLVMPGRDGRETQVVNADGDDGLDWAVTYDTYTGDVLQSTKLNKPWYLPNNSLEESINRHEELPVKTSAPDSEEQPTATYTAASHDPDETDEDDPTPDYQNDADNEL